MNVWINIVLPLVTLFLGGSGMWLFFYQSERKKREADAKKAQIAACGDEVALTRARMDVAAIKDKRFKDEITEAYAQIDAMDAKMDGLRADILTLKQSLFDMTTRAIEAENHLKKARKLFGRFLDYVSKACPDIDLSEYTREIEDFDEK